MTPSIQQIVEMVRMQHGTLLRASSIRRSAGSCLYAAYLLQTVINKFCLGTAARVRGGDGEGDGGYRDEQGAWHGHYWVEATDPDGKVFILDVTADQFGGPETVLLEAGTADQYVAGDQSIVDQHVADLQAGVVQIFGTGSE